MNEEQPPRILLVEDNPGDARYIQEMLKDTVSFEARAVDGGVFEEHAAEATADDGPLVHETTLKAGIQRLDDGYFDVVLLDLGLPDSTGLETLGALHDHDPRVPIVVLTGLQDREVGVEALRRGAEEYLVKDEINPSLLSRSVHHAIERHTHRREQKRYETLIEEAADVNAIVNPDCTIEYITPSVKHVLGYEPQGLVGENALDYVHPEDKQQVRAELEQLKAGPDYRATSDLRFRHADGSWVVLDARGRNLMDDPAIEGLVVYSRDVTEQRRYERRLETQRERLAALNQLNGVVQGVTEAVIDQSTREEIEQIACEHLAASDSYEFAWVCEPDVDGNAVEVRAAAGTGDYLDQISLTVHGEDDVADGPTATALRTGEIQTVTDVFADPDYEPWRDLAEAYGFQSAAAIPIRYENTTYGVLNVYADRTGAFREQERTVVEHLGRLLGHAIAAATRKRALLSDSVVELEVRVDGVRDGLPADVTPTDPVEFQQAIPVHDGEFLLYGTAPAGELPTLEEMTDELPSWESITELGEQDGDVSFEVRLSDPPLISKIASLGGSIERAVVDEGDLHLTIHLPQDVEARQLMDAIQAEADGAEALAHRQVTKTDDHEEGIADVWTDEFTDRQRTVVETAYLSGFFEWPRATSGEEVAEKLGISGPTFSQHLRAAENKLFGQFVGGEQSSPSDERKVEHD